MSGRLHVSKFSMMVAGMIMTLGGVGGFDAARADDPVVCTYPWALTKQGPAGTKVSDDFAKPNWSDWCDGSQGAGKLTYGDGLTLAIPPTGLDGRTRGTLGPIDDDAELLETHPFTAGQTMSIRVDATNLDGVQGSRGWGAWNGTQNTFGSEMALFHYQHTDGPDTSGGFLAGAPNQTQFMAMSQSLGSIPTVKFLDPALLKGTHTWSVTLETDSTDFQVDGKSVAHFTSPAAVPRGTIPLDTHLWIDNAFYNGSFTFEPQINAVPASVHVEWFVQGPTDWVRGEVAKRARSTTPPACLRSAERRACG